MLQLKSPIKTFNLAYTLELGRQMLKFGKILHFPTVVMWMTQFCAIIISGFLCWKMEKRAKYPYSFFFIYLWIIWAIICLIRGILSVEIYWDAKFLICNTPCLFLPLLGIIFSSPYSSLSFLKQWNSLFLLQVLLVLVGVISRSSSHFLMGPAYLLYVPLFLLLPTNKWRIILIILSVIMLSDIDARSQVIKGFVAIMIALASSFKDFYLIRLITKIMSIVLFPMAGVLLYLGITGQYNIFDHEDHTFENISTFADGKYEQQEASSVSADTRTFLYIDLLTSAVINDYLLFGRTPARGYDAPLFFAHMGTKELESDMRYERNKSEFCHPNILTWMGLIGVIIYALIFLHATILGLFFSHNVYTIYLAGFVSFNWFFGWIENIINFDMMNIGQWILIGICLSPSFRSMNNSQFKLWFTSIFEGNRLTKFHRLQFLRLYLKMKSITIFNK